MASLTCVRSLKAELRFQAYLDRQCLSRISWQLIVAHRQAVTAEGYVARGSMEASVTLGLLIALAPGEIDANHGFNVRRHRLWFSFTVCIQGIEQSHCFLLVPFLACRNQ